MGGIAAIVGFLAAILGVSNSLGYLLPAIIGLESLGIPSPGETALVAAAIPGQPGQARDLAGDLDRGVLGDRRATSATRSGAVTAATCSPRPGCSCTSASARSARATDSSTATVQRRCSWGGGSRSSGSPLRALAGINHMRFKLFFFWNALGGITWPLDVRARRLLRRAGRGERPRRGRDHRPRRAADRPGRDLPVHQTARERRSLERHSD